MSKYERGTLAGEVESLIQQLGFDTERFQVRFYPEGWHIGWRDHETVMVFEKNPDQYDDDPDSKWRVVSSAIRVSGAGYEDDYRVTDLGAYVALNGPREVNKRVAAHLLVLAVSNRVISVAASECVLNDEPDFSPTTDTDELDSTIPTFG